MTYSKETLFDHVALAETALQQFREGKISLVEAKEFIRSTTDHANTLFPPTFRVLGWKR